MSREKNNKFFPHNVLRSTFYVLQPSKRSTFYVLQPSKRFTFYVLRFTVILLFIAALTLPILSLAQVTIETAPMDEPQAVPCSVKFAVQCGCDTDGDNIISGAEQCGFNDFIKVVSWIVRTALIFASAFAALAFMYAGFLYLSSAGSMEQFKRAKGIFIKVLIGYIIMLSAWMVVKAIENALSSDAQTGASFLK